MLKNKSTSTKSIIIRIITIIILLFMLYLNRIENDDVNVLPNCNSQECKEMKK